MVLIGVELVIDREAVSLENVITEVESGVMRIEQKKKDQSAQMYHTSLEDSYGPPFKKFDVLNRVSKESLLPPNVRKEENQIWEHRNTILKFILNSKYIILHSLFFLGQLSPSLGNVISPFFSLVRCSDHLGLRTQVLL